MANATKLVEERKGQVDKVDSHTFLLFLELLNLIAHFRFSMLPLWHSEAMQIN